MTLSSATASSVSKISSTVKLNSWMKPTPETMQAFGRRGSRKGRIQWQRVDRPVRRNFPRRSFPVFSGCGDAQMSSKSDDSNLRERPDRAAERAGPSIVVVFVARQEG